jgi:hypothetical protein
MSKGRSRLLSEIGLALAFKALALVLLYVAFFAPGERARVTADTLSTHLLSSAGASRGH